jgi:hypothetical protein
VAVASVIGSHIGSHVVLWLSSHHLLPRPDVVVDQLGVMIFPIGSGVGFCGHFAARAEANAANMTR